MRGTTLFVSNMNLSYAVKSKCLRFDKFPLPLLKDRCLSCPLRCVATAPSILWSDFNALLMRQRTSSR